MAQKANTQEPQSANQASESVYSAEELANAARTRFGVLPEVVTAALKAAGKDKSTFAEAQQLIKAFMGRKVK